MKLLQNIPPYLFFTGKGGVGKTALLQIVGGDKLIIPFC